MHLGVAWNAARLIYGNIKSLNERIFEMKENVTLKWIDKRL